MKRKTTKMSKSDNELNDEFEEEDNEPLSKQKDIFGREIATVGKWNIEKDFWIFTHKDVEPSEKIAAFDMDGTLICTKSGYVHPKDTTDWKILFDCIPGMLKEMHKNGSKVVIFTNQKGIQVGKVDKQGFKRKIESIVAKIGAPVQVFIAISDGKHRKPCTGMWNEMERKNGNLEIDKNASIFVGDAAGRIKTTKRPKKDFSSADRHFAANIGVKFQTPEQFFLGQRDEEPFSKPEFDPKEVNFKDLLHPKDAVLPSKTPELIVLVGFPGSGKSKFANKLESEYGYSIVNRDTLGSWQKCQNRAYNLLSNGKSVVVDNTNPDKESRSRYTQVAKELNVGCRCFKMNCDYAQAQHHVAFRKLTNPRNNEVNSMVLRMHQSKFKVS
ncbi:hypothetical protein WR25_15714 [Diploscapter pachys]|uniref:PNK FHA domain-containing protein n=1 Tax=Diploscapter pachys TaxID=2018661 RepID=A0A2A2J3A3_9BILA|nr:hypothetical protein WR25_15714 [Diploscapter pachys]